MTQPYYIGVMSGTSLDGVDVVACDFANNTATLLASSHYPFPKPLQYALYQLITQPATTLDQLGQTDSELGKHYANVINQFIASHKLDRKNCVVIGCHGQTIRHNPTITHRFSMQIGDPNQISQLCSIDVVADFRRREIAAGGQAAPLVPIFHQHLFQQRDNDIAVLNLGGIANITIIPAASSNRSVTGFDCGPANTLLDSWYSQHHPDSNMAYDANGDWGSRGVVIEPLLQRMRSDEYFSLAPPKSTGRELFNQQWLTAMGTNSERPEDVQATLHELTAVTIANDVQHYAPDIQQLVVCGGGNNNRLLLQRLQHHLKQVKVVNSSAFGIEPQWIEAMAFAWLAKLRIDRSWGNLPSVTGATEKVVLGGVYSA